jgi:hypothetical protein
MKKIIILLFLLTMLFPGQSKADELGIRYNNAVPSGSGMLYWSPDYAGKLVEAYYDREPWANQNNLMKNIYIEGAIGSYWAGDFLDYATSGVAELSPGIKVSVGPVNVKLSQGIAVIPTAPCVTPIQFVTHLGVELQDTTSHISIGLEQTHFSNGDYAASKSLDFGGFTIGYHF